MVPSVMVGLDLGNIIAFGDLKEQKLALAEELRFASFRLLESLAFGFAHLIKVRW